MVGGVKEENGAFPPHRTTDTAGHQPVSGWSLRPVTGHGQPPGGYVVVPGQLVFEYQQFVWIRETA